MLHQLNFITLFYSSPHSFGPEGHPNPSQQWAPSSTTILEGGCGDSKLVGLQVYSKQWGYCGSMLCHEDPFQLLLSPNTQLVVPVES